MPSVASARKPADEERSTPAVAPVEVEALPAPEPVRSVEHALGVRVDIFVEGDGISLPEEWVEARVVGRLVPCGAIFESTDGKGQPPMRMELGKSAVIEGMELGLRMLTLGAVAEIHIPARLGYRHVGVPRIVPPNSDLLFRVELVAVDGAHVEPAAPVSGSDAERVEGRLRHPWWLRRVERPPPTQYYLSFGSHLARGVPLHVLERARPVPRRTRSEAAGWDLTGTALVISGVQDNWKARQEWDLEWFRRNLGSTRQLLKWQGPVFTQKECLWENPIWESSLSEYLDYVQEVDAVDPDCAHANAETCPRLYLNGWPAFKQFPWLREYVVNPTFFDDASGEFLAQNDELRELFLAGLSQGYKPPPDEERQRLIDDEYWELTKLFISPKGAITRLHYDNGGAHAWLSQVRGRKMFVCFPPSDGDHLHPFEGDEGLLNSSWLDPLDPEADQKWPDYVKATPYVAVVEEGETIVAPKGWWHYAVALDTSVTIMRNFYSKGTRQELTKRKDEVLENAVAMHVLKAKLKNQPDSVLKEIARRAVAKIREGLEQSGAPPRLAPSPGGPGAVPKRSAAKP